VVFPYQRIDEKPKSNHSMKQSPEAALVIPGILDGLIYCPGTINSNSFHASIAAAKAAVEGLTGC